MSMWACIVMCMHVCVLCLLFLRQFERERKRVCVCEYVGVGEHNPTCQLYF